MKKVYMCIDLKTFFASVECSERKLDPFKTNLVVADPSRGKGALCLAITPKMKNMGIRNRCRIFEIPKEVEYITALPKMNLYMDYSARIYEIYLRYVSEKDIHVYSIDECFLDYTNSASLFGDPVKVAYKIKDDIYRKFGFTVNVGVGNNKLLAKMASDFEKPNKVHTLFSNEVETKMFPLPIDDLFMTGRATAKKLREMGITTIGELARVPVEELTKKFKSMGKMLHDYANGIDNSEVMYEREQAKSISNSTVLPYNYRDSGMIKNVISDLSKEIGKKLRDNKLYADTIGIWFKYTYFDKISKQVKLDNSIANDEEIAGKAFSIFNELWNGEDGIRSVCVFVSGLSNERKVQLSLFDEKVEEEEKEDKLQEVIDDIRNKFGDSVIGFANEKNNK